MRQKLANLEEAMKKLRSFLPQYLSEHGIEPDKPFCCINPKHNDKNPSMSCLQNPENAFCFSCHVTSDIFQTAHWLEDKPVSGPGFVEDNVKYLADKFGVELELEEMTEDELYRHRTYRAYQAAAEIVANRAFGDQTKLDEEIKARGWRPDLEKVGTVNYKEFRDTLKAMGYEASFQNEIDLGRADIFNEDNMIFTIKDEWGRPVGFAARNLTYDGTSGVNKYTNQKTTGLRCNIYQKGRRLYEIHTAIEYTPPLYIFEGYTDVLTAQNAGLFNCAAIGGTAFTQQHVELLKQLGVYSIILVLDGDDAGKDKMTDLLDNYFCGHRDLQIELINLPDDTDPDDFIRANGLDAFLALQKWDAFQWRLNLYSDDDNPQEICEVMIPLIVNETSVIRQDAMCASLARFTGIEKKVISGELERLQNERERQKFIEKENVVNQIVSDVLRNPEDAKSILYEAADKIEEIEDKYDENTFSIESVISFVEEQKKYEEELSGEYAGFKLAPSGLQMLSNMLDGNWREDVFLAIGGRENTGKCQVGDSKVLLGNGRYKTIQDVVRDKDKHVITMTNEHKLVHAEVSDWIDCGDKECVEISLGDGISIKSSIEHQYYTLNGWKKASELQTNDHIAIAASYQNAWDNQCGRTNQNDIMLAELVAMFLSDGSITASQGFCNTEQELIDIFKHNISSLFNGMHFRQDENDTIHAVTAKGQKNPVRDYLRSLGIFGTDAYTKFIPDYIFTLHPKTISKFLGMFYSCDGWVTQEADKIEVGVSLCNLDMIKQLRSLLLRFGIRSKIHSSTSSYEKNGKRFPRHTLSISDMGNIVKFFNSIKLHSSRKQHKLFQIIQSTRKAKGAYSDNHPPKLWQHIRLQAKQKGISLNTLMELVDPMGRSMIYKSDQNRFRQVSKLASSRQFTSGIKKSILRSIGYILQDTFLISIAEGDIYFDTVEGIKTIGKLPCYDLSVAAESHNYIANDIIVHNSSICAQLGREIAEHPDNDACVIYHSIDDSKELILPRFVCGAYGNHDLTLNQVRNPNYYLKYEENGQVLAQRRQMGYQAILKLIQDGRLIIKDVKDGSSFAFGKSLIKYYRKKFPQRNIVYILDNLHKAPDYNHEREERVKFKKLSNDVKEAATKYHTCIISTVEYRKLPPGTIPSNDSIAETRALMYDANLIMHMYNDLHEKQMEAVCVHEYDGQIMPRVRLGIGKNKISSFKDRLFLDFFPASGMFRSVDMNIAEEEMYQRINMLKQIGRGRTQNNKQYFGGDDGDSPEMP